LNGVLYGGPFRGDRSGTSCRLAIGREPPFREDMSPEATTVRSRYKATTGEDTAGWKILACALVIYKTWRVTMAL
jgi:hypothetical protein